LKKTQQSGRELSFTISVKLAKNSRSNKSGSTCSCAIPCSKMQGVTQLLYRIQSPNRYLGDAAILSQATKVHDTSFFKKTFKFHYAFSTIKPIIYAYNNPDRRYAFSVGITANDMVVCSPTKKNAQCVIVSLASSCVNHPKCDTGLFIHSSCTERRWKNKEYPNPCERTL